MTQPFLQPGDSFDIPITSRTNMDKRYQVFVSSTYADLKDERQRVIQALMELDCIPAGMELFPAADEEQWAFIQRVIDDCDYYLLIIGGRYGSLTSDGISYTEKEFDYAVSKGIKVVALLHNALDQIPAGKTEMDPARRVDLQRFREKVSQNRLVKFWKTADELPGLVALSLAKTMKMYPAVGWVRADRAGSEALLTELNDVRKENDRLNRLIAKQTQAGAAALDNIADLNEDHNFTGSALPTDSAQKHEPWSVKATWSEIFGVIGPHVQRTASERDVRERLTYFLFGRSAAVGVHPILRSSDFDTIRLQFQALGLIKVLQRGSDYSWTLTDRGEAALLSIRVIRSKKSHEQERVT